MTNKAEFTGGQFCALRKLAYTTFWLSPPSVNAAHQRLWPSYFDEACSPRLANCPSSHAAAFHSAQSRPRSPAKAMHCLWYPSLEPMTRTKHTASRFAREQSQHPILIHAREHETGRTDHQVLQLRLDKGIDGVASILHSTRRRRRCHFWI